MSTQHKAVKIDRVFAFLRITKYRNYRTQLRWPSSRTDRREVRRQRLAACARAQRRGRLATWLRTSWWYLVNAVAAIGRGETMVFEIGRPFVMGDRVWICTDVGSRTICAVLLEELEASGDSGPPYSIAEQVLDNYAMDACRPLP